MKKLALLIFPLFFIACNPASIERTKELNKNNPLLKEQINSTSLDKNSASSIHNSSFKNNSSVTKSNTQQDPTIKLLTIHTQNQETIEKIKAKSQEKIEAIKANKELKIKELETKKEIQKALALKEQKAIEANASLSLAKINSKAKIEQILQESSLYKTIAIIIAILILIWLMFYYINKASKRNHEALLKEKELKYQAHIKEIELKQQNLTKMLEILTDENSDLEIKKEIAKAISQQQHNLLEYKKS